MVYSLFALAAAGLALAKPIQVVQQHGPPPPPDMAGMNMGKPAASTPAPMAGMAGMGGMNMGGGSAPYSNSTSSGPTYNAPAPKASTSPFRDLGVARFNNLQVPLTDVTKGYFEQDLDMNNPSPNTKMKIVKYGPYKVPGMGMLDGKWSFNVETPCNGCYITAIQADLKDEEGYSANVDRGAWLHHMVIYNGMGFTPFSKQDLVCSGTLLSAFMGWPHRIFASGNERIPIRLNTKHKYGLAVDDHDSFHILYDLVNLAKKEKTYYIEVKYEYVPKQSMEFQLYKPAQMLWLDITDCGTSEAPPKEGVYEVKSSGWTSTIEGGLLATIGHTHDGGVYTTLYVNDVPVCRSDQLYGTKKQYFEKAGIPNLNTDAAVMGDHGMQMAGPSSAYLNGADIEGVEYPRQDPWLDHISTVSSCINFGNIKKGDVIKIGALYNTTMHSLNRNMEPDNWSFLDSIFPGATAKYGGIMGISPVYVADGMMEAV